MDKSTWSHDYQIIIRENELPSLAITEQSIIQALSTAEVILTTPPTLISVNVLELFRIHIHWKDIQLLRRVIKQRYPDCLDSLNHVMNSGGFSQCNMFIARREFVNDYCAWLFDVLGEMEEEISFDGYDSDHRRIYGYLAEFLMNVYIHRHNFKCKYFHRVRILPLSPVKLALRKIPLCMYTVRFLRGMRWRKFTALDRLLAGRPSSESVKSFMRSAGAEEMNGFLCLTGKFNDYGSMYIAVLMPENDDADFIPALEEIMPALKVETTKEGREFLPRIVLSSGTPESVKESLRESGVRVLEY